MRLVNPSGSGGLRFALDWRCFWLGMFGGVARGQNYADGIEVFQVNGRLAVFPAPAPPVRTSAEFKVPEYCICPLAGRARIAFLVRYGIDTAGSRLLVCGLLHSREFKLQGQDCQSCQGVKPFKAHPGKSIRTTCLTLSLCPIMYILYLG
jgi:hypothetical protein